MDDLLTPEEVGELLRDVSAKTLGRWRDLGYGPAYVRAGRKILYPRSSVDAWIKTQLTGIDTRGGHRPT